MDPQTLARDILQFVHTMHDLAFERCPAGARFHVVPGSPVGSAASIYAHAVLVEDHFVAEHTGGQPLFATAAWREQFAFPPQTSLTPEWSMDLRYDPVAFQEYAARVYDRTDIFLAGLSPAAADRPASVYELARDSSGEATWSKTEKPLIYVLMDNVVTHTASHTGEIDALTGLVAHIPR